MWQERIEPISNDAVRRGMEQARVERARVFRAGIAWLWCNGRDLLDAAARRLARRRAARATRRTLHRLDTPLLHDIGIQRRSDIDTVARQLPGASPERRDCERAGTAAAAIPEGVCNAAAR